MQRHRTAISDADYARLAEFRHALRLFSSFSERAAQAAGLTSTQHQALLAIRGFGRRAPLSIGELAQRLLIRHHSAVGLVQRLISGGYVARANDPQDARRVHLELRPRGEKLLAKLTAAHRAELRRIGPLIEGLLGALGRPRRLARDSIRASHAPR